MKDKKIKIRFTVTETIWYKALKIFPFLYSILKHFPNLKLATISGEHGESCIYVSRFQSYSTEFTNKIKLSTK